MKKSWQFHLGSVGNDKQKISNQPHLAYVAIGAAIFVFLTIFMVGSHTEVYMKLLEYIVPFLGGVGGGVWLKSYWDKKG